MFPFVNRAYDAFLDWLFSHTQSRRYRLSQRLLKLEGVSGGCRNRTQSLDRIFREFKVR